MSHYGYNPYQYQNPYYHRPGNVDRDYFSRNDWFSRLVDTFQQMSTETKQLTIAYAAGASLAAITLIYVFAPTFFIDGQAMGGSGSRRKQTVVGLYNPANDCFVNSVLQALAGIGELRGFLVKRIMVQAELEWLEKEGLLEWKGRRPILTRALKMMLDRLNERPLYRKTITTRDFILELERVFRSRISRNQQDAQEFLQIVAQTLAEEYEAQEKIRIKVPKGLKEKVEAEKRAKEAAERAKEEQKSDSPTTEEEGFELVKSSDAAEHPREPGLEEAGEPAVEPVPESQPTEVDIKPKHVPIEVKIEEPELSETIDKNEGETKIPELGMPMEGKLESGIECLVCGFKPKPNPSTFIVLTLNVPQKNHATLNDCFNEHLATEFIDDFQCAKCKLLRIIAVFEHKLTMLTHRDEILELEQSIAKLKECLEKDPETLPKDIKLPASDLITVKSRIAKRTYFAHCPDILSLHLSRSIFDYYSRKNSCKVSFSEELELGPILDRSKYKLLGVVTHKGSHDSGHYECYRRQNSHPPPFSTPLMMPITDANGVKGELKLDSNAAVDTAITSGASISTPPATPATPATMSTPTLTTPTSEQPTDITSPVTSARTLPLKTNAGKAGDTLSLRSVPSIPSKPKKSKSTENRWWRISDDTVKETKTSDVLGLQKEVYLLFYEKIKVR